MIEKQTRSVAYSFGFPINVTRGHVTSAVAVMQSYSARTARAEAGSSSACARERGFNHGDYAYIEYFLGHVPVRIDLNLARPQQIFQI
jgi:hypothetical protein